MKKLIPHFLFVLTCFANLLILTSSTTEEVINVNVTITDPTCYGECNGSITITAGGGSGNYEYSIDNGQNWGYSVYYSNLCPSSYSILVRDRNNTVLVSEVLNIEIHEPNEIQINLSGDLEVCDGFSELHATTSVPVVSQFWRIEHGRAFIEDATKPSTTFSQLEQGTNIISCTVTDNMGCNSYATIEITNNQPSDAEFIGDITEKEVCVSSTQLDAVNPVYGTGEWMVVRGSAQFSDRFNPKSHVEDLAPGENILRWQVSNNGCTSYSDFTVNNHQVSALAGMDKLTCSSEIQLVASTPIYGVGEWSIAEGSAIFNDIEMSYTYVEGLAYGVNTFVWTVSDSGCVARDTITVINEQPSDATIMGDISEMEVCGSSTQLNAIYPAVGVGQWRVVGGSAQFSDAYDPKTQVEGLAQGENVLRWGVTNGSCYSSVDLTVINLQVDVDAGADQAVCSRTTQLAAVEPSIGVGEWNIAYGQATFYPNRDQANASVGGLAYGTNRLVWSVNNNYCISRDTVDVTVNVPRAVNAGPDQVIPSASAIMYAQVPIVGSGAWTLLEGAGDIQSWDSPNTEVHNLAKGVNIFRWTVTNENCSEYDEVMITNASEGLIDAGADKEICESQTQLEATTLEDGIGQWTLVSGSGDFEDINDPNTKVSNIEYGTSIYKWTVYHSTGTEIDEVTITYPQLVDKSIVNFIETKNTYATLSTTCLGAGVGYWSVITGPGIITAPSSCETEITNLISGSNIIRWRVDHNACVDSVDVEVVVNIPTDLEVYKTPTTHHLFPNPVKSALHIESSEGINSADIFTIAGKQIIHSEEYDAKKITIQLNEIQSGMYIIKLNYTSGDIVQEKFVKE